MSLRSLLRRFSSGERRLPALGLGLVLAAGIFAADRVPHAWPFLLLVLLLSSLLYIFFRSRPLGKVFAEIAFSFLIASCGFLLLSIENSIGQLETSELPQSREDLALVGRLDGPPWEARSYGATEQIRFLFLVRAQRRAHSAAWEETRCRVIVSAPLDDRLRLSGNENLALLARWRAPRGYANPGGFDYREYLKGRSFAGEVTVESPEDIFRLKGPLAGRWADPWSWVSGLRAAIFRNHEKLYPEKNVRAVASAILIGAREQVPPVIWKDFTSSGTVHVLVVSGLHVGFIAAAAFLLFSVLSGRGLSTALVSIGAVFIFALLSGGRPSVMRAAIMSAFVLFALPIQRTRVVLNTLAAAFCILLLFRASWLFDIGFQLSFTAVAGIGILTPRLEASFHARKWWENRARRYLTRLVLASLAAQLAITPLLAYYFFRISPVALIANLFIVPLAGAAVISGFAADLAGFLFPLLAGLIAPLAALFLKAMIAAAGYFAGVPWASLKVAPPGLFDIACFWTVLYLGSGLFAPGRGFVSGSLVLVCLVWINYHLWSGLFAAQRERLLVRFLDLGPAANAAVLHLPGPSTMLLDPVGKGRGKFSAAGEVIPPYLVRYAGRRIDWLLLRSEEPGEIRWAWDILDNFEIGTIIIPPVESPSILYTQFLEYGLSKGVHLRLASQGDTLKVGRTKFFYFRPEAWSGNGRLEKDPDRPPLIPLVEHEGRRVIFSGALSELDLQKILFARAGLKCDVLEWPQGLYGVVERETVSRLMSLFQPELVIMPSESGIENPETFSQPSDSWGSAARLLETAFCGAVSLSFERGGLKLGTERTESRNVKF